MSDTIPAAYTTLVLAGGVSPYQSVALGTTATLGGTIQNAAGVAGPIAWIATATTSLAPGASVVSPDFGPPPARCRARLTSNVSRAHS